MSDKERAELGLRLREAREYRGFSQDDVARQLGVPRSAVSLMESGTRRVEVLELSRLAKLYNCSMAELTGESRSSDAEPKSVQMLARAAAVLSPDDQLEVLRFAEFLRTQKHRTKKP
jgi:transcriptional regulator with XRE-family HTH domain